jgi:hypothetical protein
MGATQGLTCFRSAEQRAGRKKKTPQRKTRPPRPGASRAGGHGGNPGDVPHRKAAQEKLKENDAATQENQQKSHRIRAAPQITTDRRRGRRDPRRNPGGRQWWGQGGPAIMPQAAVSSLYLAVASIVLYHMG